jgi:hypothetical protein
LIVKNPELLINQKANIDILETKEFEGVIKSSKNTSLSKWLNLSSEGI